MREHIDACISRHGRRRADHKLSIQNRDVRKKTGIDQRILRLGGLVRDHGEIAHLGAGSARGGDRDEADLPELLIDPACDEDNRLCRVDGRAAAEADHRIRHEGNKLFHTPGHHAEIRLRRHLGVHLILLSRAVQSVGDVLHLSADRHEVIRDDEYLVHIPGKLVQTVSQHNVGSYCESFHVCPPLSIFPKPGRIGPAVRARPELPPAGPVIIRPARRLLNQMRMRRFSSRKKSVLNRLDRSFKTLHRIQKLYNKTEIATSLFSYINL